jgi:hypothetical protein
MAVMSRHDDAAAIATGTPRQDYREFRRVSGNGPEWVTFPLRACVATGRAHCAKSPRKPPRAMQASEVFLLRLSVQVPDYFGPHSTFSNISTIWSAIDTYAVLAPAAAQRAAKAAIVGHVP